MTTRSRVVSADVILATQTSVQSYAKSPQPSPRRPGIDRVAQTKRTSLHLPLRLSLEGWQRIGEQIGLITDSSTWWLGDWLVYGQEAYPERYRQAVEKTSLDYQTLRNYAWVVRRFEVSRRRSGLSFQHHAEVAALPEAEQDRWLDQAELGGWSRNELRKRIRDSRRELQGDQDTPRLHLDASAEQRQRWKEAADKANQDLVEWMRVVLDEAARDAVDERC